jgi:hypothetical protein
VCVCVCVRFFPPLRAGSAGFCASLFSQVFFFWLFFQRRRVWGFVVDRFPFAEGLGVKRRDRKRICFFHV